MCRKDEEILISTVTPPGWSAAASTPQRVFIAVRGWFVSQNGHVTPTFLIRIRIFDSNLLFVLEGIYFR